MEDLWNYDETDPASTERYAQKLIGKTFWIFVMRIRSKIRW